MPTVASPSRYQAPAWPPSTATIEPSSPRWRAARTTLAALPPGTTARTTGRWMAPGTRWSTLAVLSMAALSATPMTRRTGSPVAAVIGSATRAAAASASAPGGLAVRAARLARGQGAACDAEPERAREGRALEPRGEEPGIERVAGAGRVDGLDGESSDALDRPVGAHDQRPVGTALHGDDPVLDAGDRGQVRAAASTSSMPASPRHSAAFGSSTSASAAAAAKPPSHASAGSQLGSRLVVAPPSRAARNRPGSSAARPGWRKKLPTWRWRARASSARARRPRAASADRAQRREDRPIACRCRG